MKFWGKSLEINTIGYKNIKTTKYDDHFYFK